VWEFHYLVGRGRVGMPVFVLNNLYSITNVELIQIRETSLTGQGELNRISRKHYKSSYTKMLCETLSRLPTSRLLKDLLELITLQCQKQTHKRQKILTKQFSLDQESASMCSLPLNKHASTKWLTVAPPYIPDAVVPAPHLGFV
jgi:hypothetical protein